MDNDTKSPTPDKPSESEEVNPDLKGVSENEENDELPTLDEGEAEEVIVLEQGENDAMHDEEEKDDDDNEGDRLNGTSVNDTDANGDEGSEDMEMTPQLPVKDDAFLVLTDHTNETLAVAASPINKSLVITGGMDDCGHIWDLEHQQSLAKVDGGEDSVSVVAFSHDGKYAAFASENGSLSIVFMDGSESPAPSALEGPGDTITFLSWHPRGPVLLAGSADRAAYMWNAAKGKFMMAFTGHEDEVTCGSFTTDGKQVVTASKDSSIRVWNPFTGDTVVKIQAGVSSMRGTFHTADIQCIAVGNVDSVTEKLIVSGCAAGDLFITQRESAQVIAQLPRHEGGVESIAFSPNAIQRVFIACGGADGIVRVWDVEGSIERCKFSHDGVIAKVVWHPSKPILLTGCADGSVSLWDVLRVQLIVKLTGHHSFITDLCFNNDASVVVSTSADRTVRVFDVRDHVASVASTS